MTTTADGERTMRLPVLTAYYNAPLPTLPPLVVTEPVAPLERLATAADYVGHHRKPETLLGRAWSRLCSWVGAR